MKKFLSVKAFLKSLTFTAKSAMSFLILSPSTSWMVCTLALTRGAASKTVSHSSSISASWAFFLELPMAEGPRTCRVSLTWSSRSSLVPLADLISNRAPITCRSLEKSCATPSRLSAS